MANNYNNDPNNTLNQELQNISMVEATSIYVQLARNLAEYTRLSTEELTKIITSIHQANQVT